LIFGGFLTGNAVMLAGTLAAILLATATFRKRYLS
jgi:hypothetical protein